MPQTLMPHIKMARASRKGSGGNGCSFCILVWKDAVIGKNVTNQLGDNFSNRMKLIK